jgi:sterol 3beta-glucosyltransferase
MNIGIITYGTRGDVQPYLALALGLKAKGHKVTLAAPENFKDFVEDYGINFHPIHGNVNKLLYSPEGISALKTGNALTLLVYMRKAGKLLMPLITRDILDVCSKVDMMIASPLTFLWVDSVAVRQHKKWAFFQLGPIVTPTKYFPFIGFAFFNNPVYNFQSHKFFNFIHWMINRNDVNKFRTSLGIGKLKQSIFRQMEQEKILNLYGISPALIPRPADWESHNDITGFLSLSDNSNLGVPQELKTWLGNGEAPIYIGFGSMPVPDPELLSNILSDIIGILRCRVIFCKGWSVMENLPDHPDLFVIESIDHEWLFPQCKAILFHGGIGTLATCLKSGIPPIVISIAGDQPWNGELIRQKKLGCHIPFKKLTRKRLTAALLHVDDTEIRTNISTISGKMKKEKGLDTAVDEIEKYFIANQTQSGDTMTML